jgi:hypothetical protein
METSFSTFFENRSISSQLGIEDQKKLAEFLVDVLVKSEAGDPEAQKILEMSPDQIQQLIQSQPQQNIQTEAFENLRSGFSSMMGNDRAVARFNMMVSNLNKQLWELENDLKNANVQNNIEYKTMLGELQRVDPNIKPEGGVFQKKAYGVGRTVGKVGAFAAKTGSIFAAAATLGSLGLPAYAIGGIIGGGVSALKNLKNQNLNKTQKLKKILVSAGLGAVLGFAFSKLRAMTDGVDFSSSPDADTSSAAPDTSSATPVADTSTPVSGDGWEGRIIPSPNGDGVLIEVEVEIDDTFGAAKGKLQADAQAKLKALYAYANEVGGAAEGMSIRGMQPVSAEVVDGVLKKTFFLPKQ